MVAEANMANNQQIVDNPVPPKAKGGVWVRVKRLSSTGNGWRREGRITKKYYRM